ncbi:DoxX family membrane protein [Phaeacidiphilus oryzae]|uniref:DoxX family membrane protein n=1 Tax=Phaeacidiphilus oryzae TaxID=348818 RepID=UPI000A815541|nr:DoxX family protein [Phaeacidiphilus oryzae]
MAGRDLGMLVLRVGVGGVLTAHGTQKLLGWFGGPGLEGAAQGFHAMGFRPGRTNAIAAGLGEAGAGALLVAGLGTGAAGAAAAGTMAVAATVHADKGFFAQQGGYEYPAVLGACAAGLALAGPGRFSLDRAIGHRLDRPWQRRLALVAAGAAAYSVVSRRRRALAAAAAAAPEPVQEEVPEAESTEA